MQQFAGVSGELWKALPGVLVLPFGAMPCQSDRTCLTGISETCVSGKSVHARFLPLLALTASLPHCALLLGSSSSMASPQYLPRINNNGIFAAIMLSVHVCEQYGDELSIYVLRGALLDRSVASLNSTHFSRGRAAAFLASFALFVASVGVGFVLCDQNLQTTYS